MKINGENKNAVIKFEGTGGKLYEHIVKSSMNFDKCSLYPELIINTEIEKENVEMNTYKVGDKVIIRKDLLVGVGCGNYWYELVEFMKNYNYGVIDKVDRDGDYWLKGYDVFVTEEMIEGLYEEEKEMNNISNTMKPKKLHVVELKDGRVLDVPFGKLVIVIDTFAKVNITKYLNMDDRVFVLASEIKMIQNVEV